jgi:hypothetical protein
MEQKSPAVEGPLERQFRPLRERLHNHLSMMQPHQRERLTGALLFEATEEIDRLHEWADGFSDAQLRERVSCEAHIQSMRDTIGEIAVRMAKDSAYRHRAAEDLLALALRPNVRHERRQKGAAFLTSARWRG